LPGSSRGSACCTGREIKEEEEKIYIHLQKKKEDQDTGKREALSGQRRRNGEKSGAGKFDERRKGASDASGGIYRPRGKAHSDRGKKGDREEDGAPEQRKRKKGDGPFRIGEWDKSKKEQPYWRPYHNLRRMLEF